MAARSIATGTSRSGWSRSRSALLGRRVRLGRLVQHAARQVRGAAEAAVRLPEGRRDRRRATRWSRATSSRRTSTSRSRRTSSRRWRRRRTQAIEITEFVPAAEGRPGLLRRRLLPRPRQGRRARPTSCSPRRCSRPAASALAKYAARGKQYLVLLRPIEQRPRDAAAALRRRGAPVRRGAARRRRGEGRRAQARDPAHRPDRLREFQPEHYEDEVKKRIHEAIQTKVEGQEITAAPEAPEGADHRPDGGAQGEPRRQERRRRAAKRRSRRPKATGTQQDRRRGPPRAAADARHPRPRRARCRRLRALPAPPRVVPRGRARQGQALPRPGVLGPARARASAIPGRGCWSSASPPRPTAATAPAASSPATAPAICSSPRSTAPASPTSRSRSRATTACAARLLRRAGRALRPARQQADAGRDRALPRVPRCASGRSWSCGPCWCSAIALDGFLACCAKSGRMPRRAASLRPRRRHDLGGGCGSSARTTSRSRTPSPAS